MAGHRWMGLFVAALIVVGAVGAFAGTRSAPFGQVTGSEPSLRAQLAVAGRNRPFRVLLICFVVQSVGIAVVLAGVDYFAGQILRDPQTGTTVLFACFIGPALLVMPLWSRVGARLGKRAGLVRASLLLAVPALALAAAPLLPAVAVYLLVALMGCGYAGQQVFALAMLPDCISYDTARTGRRQAGVFTGLWTAGETFGLALGPGIFGLVLQLTGYVSSSTGAAAVQSDDGAARGADRFHRAPGTAGRGGGAAAARLRPHRRTARQPPNRRRPCGRRPKGRSRMVEALPAQGVPADQVLDEIRGMRAADRPTHGGRLFAYVYDPAVPGLDELARSAHALSAHVNGLDPTAFPSLLAMENALVGAAADAARRRPRHHRAGCRRQRHQRRHRVADPGGEDRPGRPAGDHRAAPGRPGHRPRRLRQGRPLPGARPGPGAGLAGHPAPRPGRHRRRDHAPTPCWSPAPRPRTRTA